MPELPEVETVRLGLEPEMTGKIIANADVRRPDLRWPFPKNMAGQLTGAKVLRLRRRSKYILCDLDSDCSLLIHLGMSGRMTITKPEQGGGDILGNFHKLHPTPEKHDHVVLDMETGVRITFNDARRFGAMDLIPTSEIEQHKLIAILGPEPFGNDFNDAYLFEKIRNKKSPIKSVLLDQSIVAGLGNIYVCEVLWRAGISPTKLAGTLSKPRIASLVPIIREVLEEAIQAGGSSLKDHRQANGELGYFQHSFAVYGREKEECRTQSCSTLIKRIVQSGRSTFFCSKCQK